MTQLVTHCDSNCEVGAQKLEQMQRRLALVEVKQLEENAKRRKGSTAKKNELKKEALQLGLQIQDCILVRSPPNIHPKKTLLYLGLFDNISVDVVCVHL